MLVAALLIFISCKKENTLTPVNELDGLQLVTTISNDKHKISLYTASGKFQTGYNAIFIQIKNTEGTPLTNTTISWKPTMHMMSMSHSCPYSSIAKKENAQSVYTGYVVFQMAGSEMEYWEIEIDYTVDGIVNTAKGKIQVTAASKRVVESFQGSDSKRYVMALVEPAIPRVAVNDIKVVLYRMESMMNFVTADNYTIKIDPRMPGMGNHGSPNNVNLTQGTDKMYYGKLSLTMTGFWKINLQLADASQNILKGEPVTDVHEASSIFFELEF